MIKLAFSKTKDCATQLSYQLEVTSLGNCQSAADSSYVFVLNSYFTNKADCVTVTTQAAVRCNCIEIAPTSTGRSQNTNCTLGTKTSFYFIFKWSMSEELCFEIEEIFE